MRADARVQVWDHAGAGCVRWSAADVGLPRMGIVSENSLLQAALLRAAGVLQEDGVGASAAAAAAATASAPGDAGPAAGRGGVEGVWPAAIAGCDLPAYAVSGDAGGREVAGAQPEVAAEASSGSALAKLRLEDGRELRCRLLVGADGGRSRVRELAGLR